MAARARALEQGYAISSLCNTRPYNLTGVPVMTLTEIGHAITKIPDHFMAHPKVLDLYERRRMNLDAGKVDMAMAELLAAGTFCKLFSLARMRIVPQVCFTHVCRQEP